MKRNFQRRFGDVVRRELARRQPKGLAGIGCRGKHAACRFAAKHTKRIDDGTPVEHGGDLEIGDEAKRAGLKSGFFPQLPSRRCFMGFADFHLATGKGKTSATRRPAAPHHEERLAAPERDGYGGDDRRAAHGAQDARRIAVRQAA